MTDDEDEPRRPRNRDRDRDRDDGDEDRPRRRRDDEEEDWEDDRPRRRRRRPEPDPDPALKYVVPLNTSALAIIAGYVGLVSVLCFPAPFALLLGFLALQQLKNNPRLDGKGRAIFAIVMGGVFSLIFLVLVILVVAGGLK